MHRYLVPLTLAALPLASAWGQGVPTPVPAASAAPLPAPATSVQTPAAPGLTLSTAIDTALRQHPLLRAYGHELEAGDAAIQQAGLVPNPSLSLEQEDNRAETRTRTVQLSQTFELGGKRAARVALAQRSRDLAALDLESRRADIRASVIQAFFELAIAQERLKVADASLQLADGSADAVGRRVIAGKVSPTEATRARIAVADARIERRHAEAELASARQALTVAMGAPVPGSAPVDSQDLTAMTPAAPVDLDARIAAAPGLRRARMAVEQANAAFDLERARGMPDVTVGLGATRAADIGRTQPVISVSMPIPLFDRNQGGQREALRRRDAAQARAEAEELRLRADVQQIAAQLQARVDEVGWLRGEIVPDAQSAYAAARRGFELGKFGFFDVLDAQRTLLQAQGRLFAALSQAQRLAAELDRQLGTHADQR